MTTMEAYIGQRVIVERHNGGIQYKVIMVIKKACSAEWGMQWILTKLYEPGDGVFTVESESQEEPQWSGQSYESARRKSLLKQHQHLVVVGGGPTNKK